MFERKGINNKISSHLKDISVFYSFFYVRGSRNEFESAMSLQSTNYLTAYYAPSFLHGLTLKWECTAQVFEGNKEDE